MYSLAAQTASDTGVRGVALNELLIASIAGAIFTVLLLTFGELLRTGRLRRVSAAYEAVGKRLNMPPWAGAPLIAYLLALLVGAVGMMWDVNYHLETGRELGLIGQPSHALALGGIFTMVAASYIAMMHPGGPVGKSAIRLSKTRQLPLGPSLTFLASAGGLMSFPLDDLWHRLFGLDVALWSPIHFILISSFLCAAFGILIWIVEGQSVANDQAGKLKRGQFSNVQTWSQVIFLGAIAAAAAVFLDEWNLGVPQARMVFDPILTAAVVASYVAARILGGRGKALAAGLVSFAIFSIFAAFVGGVLDFRTPIGPLMIPQAIAVEIAALVLGTQHRYRFGIAAGFSSFALAMPAEYGWSQLVRPVPWSPGLTVDIVQFALPVSIGMAVLGVFCASVLQRESKYVTSPRGSFIAIAATSVIVVTLTLAAIPRKGPEATADLRTNTAVVNGQQQVKVAAKFTPANFADDADYVIATSWQGAGISTVHLKKDANGYWTSADSVPYGGKRKTVIRVANGPERYALAVSFPEETDIGEPAIKVVPSVTRQLVGDKQLMQRERIKGTGSTLVFIGTAVCTFVWFLLLMAAGLTFMRFGSDGQMLSWVTARAKRLRSTL